jgi:hypothetical protein
MASIPDPAVKVMAVSLFEISDENNKKAITEATTYFGDELSTDDTSFLVEQNVAGMWNANEKHAINKKASAPAIKVAHRKIRKQIVAEIMGFDKTKEAAERKKLLNALVSSNTKAEFEKHARTLCDHFKGTNYSPKVLIGVAKFSVGKDDYVGFFTHSLVGGFVKEATKLMRVKKALTKGFQKAFIFPYLDNVTEAVTNDKVKFKDFNQRKADYMPKFLGLEKHHNPNDTFTEFCRNEGATLEEAYKAVNKNGKFSPYTEVFLKDEGLKIYTNLETFKKRVKIDPDGKTVSLTLSNPNLFDAKRRKINHLVGLKDGKSIL